MSNPVRVKLDKTEATAETLADGRLKVTVKAAVRWEGA